MAVKYPQLEYDVRALYRPRVAAQSRIYRLSALGDLCGTVPAALRQAGVLTARPKPQLELSEFPADCTAETMFRPGRVGSREQKGPNVDKRMNIGDGWLGAEGRDHKRVSANLPHGCALPRCSCDSRRDLHEAPATITRQRVRVGKCEPAGE